MAKVIVIANQKGGVGKTTTAVTLAPVLTSLGKKTLLIDTDMQCNATDVYAAKTDDIATMYDVIIDRSTKAEDAIQHTEYGDIIAGDRLLVNAEIELTKDAITGISRIKTAIDPIRDQYDFIIIDTNPAVNRLLLNSLVAADSVLIPTSADRFGLVGLSQILETINAVKAGPNPNLEIEGVLINKFKSNMNLERQVKEELEKQANAIGIKICKTFIRESVKMREAQSLHVSPLAHKNYNASVKDFIQLAQEIIGE